MDKQRSTIHTERNLKIEKHELHEKPDVHSGVPDV